MGARLRIILSPLEEQTLFELRPATTVSQRVKDRAEMIRLIHQGMYVEKIAALFKCNARAVRQTLHRWQKNGLEGLWDAPHLRAERRWQPEDIEYLETCLRQEKRTYNSQQLSKKLASERNVHLSADRIRQILKKRG